MHPRRPDPGLAQYIRDSPNTPGPQSYPCPVRVALVRCDGGNEPGRVEWRGRVWRARVLNVWKEMGAWWSDDDDEDYEE